MTDQPPVDPAVAVDLARLSELAARLEENQQQTTADLAERLAIWQRHQPPTVALRSPGWVAQAVLADASRVSKATVGNTLTDAAKRG